MNIIINHPNIKRITEDFSEEVFELIAPTLYQGVISYRGLSPEGAVDIIGEEVDCILDYLSLEKNKTNTEFIMEACWSIVESFPYPRQIEQYSNDFNFNISEVRIIDNNSVLLNLGDM